MFKLVERFLSLQGEGRYAGVPSYFLRTGGCNLRCEGFGTCYEVDGERRRGCDTWRGVDPAFAHEWEGVRQAEALLASIDEALASLDYRPHIVVTGGEPLIHAADPVFYEVIRGLRARGLFVAFESNGTQEPDFERFPAYRECCYALSVKLSNSAEPRERRIRPAALKGIAREAREHFLKFALDRELIASGEAEAEIAEIRAILPGTEIYCMPVGESRIALARNARAVFEFCMERGYHYSDRLHIRIYDTQTGV